MKPFTNEEALRVAEKLGIDWAKSPFDLEQFRRGLDVELEHGTHDPETNVTDDDPVMTGKIALAHLRELPDYYTRLERMEAEAGS
ncbi:MAG: DUF5661 family protein [Actinomycetota bacterium]